MLAGICCQGSDTVAIVDLDAYERRGSVPVGGHPVDAIAAEGRLFVATMDERAVSVVDTDGTVRTVNTGVLGPSHFALAAERLFVSCTGGDVVAALDPHDLELVGRVPTGAEPHGIVTYGGLVYVGSRADGRVTVFDPDSLSVIATIAVDGEARLQDLEADGAVYAVDQEGARVIKLDADGVHAVAPVGANPYAVSLDAEGSVYVPGRDDGTVHVFDADLRDGRAHEVAPGAADVEFVAGECWVACSEVEALHALGGTVIDLPSPAFRLRAIDDSRLLVTHRDAAAVSVVDVREGRLAATMAVDEHPMGAVVL